MRELSFELATLSDIVAINELYYLCSEHAKKIHDFHHWENQYPQELLRQRIHKKLVFKAIFNGEFVGSFMLEVEYPKPCIDIFIVDRKPFRYLKRLALHPKLQKMGLGSRMLKEAEMIAKFNGAVILRLDLLEGYEELLNFYIKNGYKKIGVMQSKTYIIAFMEKEL